MLASRPWDGNVRELRNTIERACMLAEGPLLTDRDVTRDTVAGGPGEAGAATDGLVPGTLDRMERERIVDVLRTVAGNKQAAARILGVSRRAFYRRLERYGLHTASSAASGGPARP